MRWVHTRAGRFRKRAWRLAISAIGGVSIAIVSVAAASDRGAHATANGGIVALSASPALTPAFHTGTHDYVVRSNKRLRLRLTVAAGAVAWIDGRLVDGERTSESLIKRDGEATVISTQRGTRRTSYHLRCLPSDFPAWRVKRSGRTQAGWYLAAIDRFWDATAYVTIFNRDGTPVWWRRGGDRAPTLLSGDRIGWNHSVPPGFGSPKSPFRLFTLDGRAVGQVHAVRAITDDHELRELPNGDFVILGTRPRRGVDLRPYGGPPDATVLDGVVQEVTPAGRLVWEWSTRDHISLAETGRWFKLTVLPVPERLAGGEMAYDTVHLNSVEVHGRRVLISARYTDALYDIDRSSGRIVWKLGGTTTPRSLRLSRGSASALFGGQHDARVLPDGTVTVHDNRYARRRPPRALRFRIDERRMRATLLEGIDRQSSSFADCCGSARKLAGGDWVVSWGGLNDFEELTPRGRSVLRVSFPPGRYSYRVVPFEPGALSIGTLRSAMDAAARRAAR